MVYRKRGFQNPDSGAKLLTSTVREVPGKFGKLLVGSPESFQKLWGPWLPPSDLPKLSLKNGVDLSFPRALSAST